MKRFAVRLAAAGFAVALALATGCNKKPAEAPAPAKKPAEHEHTESPHKGALAEWGDHEYHAEFVVDHDAREATVYVLDGDAQNAKPIRAGQLTVALAEQPAVVFTLAATARDGDPPGTASRFVGRHDALATNKPFAGTISVEAAGKKYSGAFKERPHGGHAPEAPSSAGAPPTQREKDLFLKPGGVYTQADIEKNGGTVPSVKYRGVAFDHDDDLKPGDKLCPVTVNKADEKCSWWVNGKKYEFCCPPCLEKFVRQAKESPEKIKDPSEYVQK